MMRTGRYLTPDLSAAPTKRGSGGFTLMEMVISIVLVGMIAAVGTSMLTDTFSTARMVNANNASAGQARYALERLAREIREIKYDSTGASFCITTMTTTPPKLVFYGTPQGTAYNSTCATNANIVTIDTSGSSLRLGYTIAGVTTTSSLSNQLGSLTFGYLDANLATTTLASAIRFVVITLTVLDSSTGVQSTVQRTRVALRNS